MCAEWVNGCAFNITSSLNDGKGICRLEWIVHCCAYGVRKIVQHRKSFCLIWSEFIQKSVKILANGVWNIQIDLAMALHRVDEVKYEHSICEAVQAC